MTQIKNIYIIPLLFFLLLSVSGFGQSVIVSDFNLTSDGADVLLEWELPDESGIIEYRLYRRLNQNPSQDHIVTIKADGSGSYRYLDDGIFKRDSKVIHYDLEIIQERKTDVLTNSITHNPTSIQRTWGSIKAMFKP
jgi:hypothetical protein